MNYRVGKHMALKGKDGIFHQPGEKMTGTRANELFQNVSKLEHDGKLVPAEYAHEAPISPFVDQKPIPPVMDTRPDKPEPHPIRTTDRSAPRTAPPWEPVPELLKAKYGSWTLDPTALEGRDINELNVMIAERTHPTDETQEFETPEEAIAWLSQDYESEDAPQVSIA